MFKRINIEIVPLTEEIRSRAVVNDWVLPDTDLVTPSTPTPTEIEDASAKPEIRAE